MINHHCAAVGLFSTTDESLVNFKAIETDKYSLKMSVELSEDDKRICEFTADVSTNGRSKIGHDVLFKLRELMDIPASEWGDLVGVRPTKLFHKQWDKLKDIEKVEKYLKTERGLSDKKVNLLSEIAKLQRKYLTKINKNDISIYAGIPFCTSHCAYCSFPFGLVQQFKELEEFQKAYLMDIKGLSKVIKDYNLAVDTMYMGGGTPTSLDNEMFALVLSELAQLVPEGHEFTVEAGRPDTVTKEKIMAMVKANVNRISINPQTMQQNILKKIGRNHTVESITQLYDFIRMNTSFAVNMDFIAGLPGQKFEDMQENMGYVCKKMPENVTIHTLALKKGSPLYRSKLKDEVPLATEVKAMVEYCSEQLEKAGYKPYYLYRQQYMRASMENVGYALPGYESVYNIQMMEERQNIIGIGPGSTSKWINPKDFRQIKQYMPRNVSVYISEQEELQKKRFKRVEDFYRKDL